MRFSEFCEADQIEDSWCRRRSGEGARWRLPTANWRVRRFWDGAWTLTRSSEGASAGAHSGRLHASSSVCESDWWRDVIVRPSVRGGGTSSSVNLTGGSEGRSMRSLWNRHLITPRAQHTCGLRASGDRRAVANLKKSTVDSDSKLQGAAAASNAEPWRQRDVIVREPGWRN